MAIKDIGKGLKEKSRDAADFVKDKVRDIDTDEIKDNIMDAADSVKDKIKNSDPDAIKENVQNAAAKVKDKVLDAGGKALDHAQEYLKKDEQEPEPAERDLSLISAKDALKLFYYLMAADGNVSAEEEERFDSIGKELDPEYETIRDEIVSDCKARIDVAKGDDEYIRSLCSYIDHIIEHTNTVNENVISSLLLIWDMLTIAYSDRHYDESEKELIDYIAGKLEIDKAEYAEMQSSILTLLDLERELNWVKTTDRPYLTIEAHVNEIKERISAIMEGVLAMFML